MLPWFLIRMSERDNGCLFFVVDAQLCRNASLECAFSGLAATGVTSPVTSLQKEQRENIGFRGHGTWLTGIMPKTPLLLLQMLPWFLVRMSERDNGCLFFIVNAQLCRNASLECAFSGLAATGVTSPATSLQKEQRENIGFRGHGTWLTGIMPKTPLLLLQGASCLQLIDFGRAVDMSQLPPGTTFTYVVKTDGFVCTEMCNSRPWTLQTDWFDLQGCLHVLLFGDCMEVEKMPNSTWSIRRKFKRYWQQDLWNRLFSTLLSIPSCSELPDITSIAL
ncbi:uncharacterized protein LOC119437522 isoform X2 [Dermacentor silvarum]|nr:uncharacterized protein LOC119437522 isoform X2 [Dermacentor silvarum]XP_049516606.1 uncharacterized protein LOC119437522 isoform X2 [Dermacentor silvarum]